MSEDTTNVVSMEEYKKARAAQVESTNTQQETQPVPQQPPQTYHFRLLDGSERVVTGYLVAGPGQIMIGDEHNQLLYLVPIDSLLEIIRVEATANTQVSSSATN